MFHSLPFLNSLVITSVLRHWIHNKSRFITHEYSSHEKHMFQWGTTLLGSYHGRPPPRSVVVRAQFSTQKIFFFSFSLFSFSSFLFSFFFFFSFFPSFPLVPQLDQSVVSALIRLKSGLKVNDLLLILNWFWTWVRCSLIALLLPRVDRYCSASGTGPVALGSQFAKKCKPSLPW